MPPRGLFGIPHGILSSTDEQIAFLIGLIALLVAVLHNGRLDLQPLTRAASLGIVIALAGSVAAPAPIANEWHIPVIVVLLVVLGVIMAYRRDDTPVAGENE